MKHRRKAKVRNRESSSAKMWTASESSESESKDRLNYIEGEFADLRNSDSFLSEDDIIDGSDGRFMRAQNRLATKREHWNSKARRAGFLGLPGSLWITGFVVLGATGLFALNQEGRSLTGFRPSDFSISKIFDQTSDSKPADASESSEVSESSNISETSLAESEDIAGPSVTVDASDEKLPKESSQEPVVVPETETEPNIELNIENQQPVATSNDSEKESSPEVGSKDTNDNELTADNDGVEKTTASQLATAATALVNEDPEAESIYREIVADDPDNAEALGGLAVIREQALLEMTALIETNALSEARNKLEDVDGAVESQKLDSIKTQIDDLSAMSEDIEQQLQQAKQEQTPWWIAEGDRRVASGNLSTPENRSAIDAYAKAVELQPDSQKAVSGLYAISSQLVESARISIDEQRFDDAGELLESAQVANDVVASNGVADLVDTDANRQITILSEELTSAQQTTPIASGNTDPDRVEALLAKADQLLSEGELLGEEGAIFALDEVFRIAPTNPGLSDRHTALVPALMEAANLAVSNGQWGLANAYMNQALELEPDNQQVLSLQQGVKTLAEQSEKVQQTTNTADDRLSKGIILGDYGAIALYQKVLIDEPENRAAQVGLINASNRLAMLAAKDILNNNMDFARSKLEAALEVQPNDQDLIGTLQNLPPPTPTEQDLPDEAPAPVAAPEEVAENIEHSDPVTDTLLAGVFSEQPLAEDQEPSLAPAPESSAEDETSASGESAEDTTVDIASVTTTEGDTAVTVPEVEISDTEQTVPAIVVSPDSNATEHCQNDYDCIGMVIDSGDPVLIQMGQEMSKMVTGNSGGTVVKPTKGPIANTALMLSRENAGLSVVPSDMLSYTDRSGDPALMAASRRLRFIMTIGQKTVFLVAGKEIRSVSDLTGRRVVMGPENTAIWVVASNLVALHEVTPAERITQKPPEGLLSLLAGTADAVFVVGPNPHPLLKNLSKMKAGDKYAAFARDLHVVPITVPAEVTEYVADTANYSNLADNISTVAILPTLVSYDFTHKESPYFQRRCDELANVGSTIVARLTELQESGHKQWKSTSWSLQAGSWKKDECFFRDVNLIAKASDSAGAQEDASQQTPELPSRISEEVVAGETTRAKALEMNPAQ